MWSHLQNGYKVDNDNDNDNSSNNIIIDTNKNILTPNKII